MRQINISTAKAETYAETERAYVIYFRPCIYFLQLTKVIKRSCCLFGVLGSLIKQVRGFQRAVGALHLY